MNPRKKILFLTSRIPFPLEKGDKLRAYYQIKYLSKENDIVLCCISDTEITDRAKEELSKYTTAIYIYKTSKLSILSNLFVAWLKGLPFQIGYFFNSGAHFYFNSIVKKEKPDHIFVQLIRMAEYVSKIKSIPKSLDYMDTFSKGMERRMDKASGIKKSIFKFEFNRLRKYEERVFNIFDNSYIISKQDQESFSFPSANQIKISPNGVDHHFFQPDLNREKIYDIVFTGNMSYPPNVNAVVYLVKEILPLLKEQLPNIQILIAGATPNSTVKSLASENVHISGWLDDIRDAYNDAKIFLAPLQIGTGLQNKLLEAMSMELPCITSELANNALGAKPNQEILIGQSPEDYANHVINLLNSNKLCDLLKVNGKEFVTKTYNWNSITSDLTQDFFS